MNTRMFKLGGILCILAGCIGWGCSRTSEEKCRIRHLKELIRIIKRIQNEISYGKHTLPEICLILAECGDVLYRPYFQRIYEQVGRENGASLTQVWEQQIGQCLREAPLSEEEKGILRDLPQSLGLLEEKQQAESIGQNMELLVRACAKAEESYENKSKMILSVSLLTGIFLTILVL
ncbi:MAG: hypothetical protein HDR04_20060 [Lachnospiraceae bacterium]|nr:hypothetical protein [Lachnospiraceae bacterium]